MLGKVFSLQAVYEDVVASLDTETSIDEWYYTGVMIYLMFDFDPVSDQVN